MLENTTKRHDWPTLFNVAEFLGGSKFVSIIISIAGSLVFSTIWETMKNYLSLII